MIVDDRQGKVRACFLAIVAFLFLVSQVQADPHFIDLSKAANRGLAESFDEAVSGIPDLKEKNGLTELPVGAQTFRGIPFQILDSAQNQGHSFIVLKSRRKPDFPDGVSIQTGSVKAAFLYFLHTCRWGGTAQNITVAEYDIVYEDGQVSIVPLRVGVEFTNFFGADDTGSSYLAWWHKYKNTEMGLNLFPWKNPQPDKAIQSILFKSRNSSPLPILFAITSSDKELPVSPDSPKPEKTFQTDTSKWIPFEPTGASPAGTAIDMSFLLDAPAGKHGRVRADGDKLVFEDGTPAKFWGAPIVSFVGNTVRDDTTQSLSKPDPLADLVDRLGVSGCNAVLVEKKLNNSLIKALKQKGIYVFFREGQTDLEPTKMATPDLISPDDPAVIDSTLVNWGRKTWDFNDGSLHSNWYLPGNKAPPLQFRNTPMVMSPAMSLPLQLSESRVLGRPFAGQWAVDWPNEFSGEIPLILSASAALQGWNASFGLNGEKPAEEFMDPSESFFNKPQILAQWPIAALAYLRGDLKEGKVYVIDKNGSSLKALAHKSGLQPEGGKFKTDAGGLLKAKVNEKTKSFISDTGQISWQGNVGVVKVETPRFQAVIGFLSHRKFNNPYWAVETPNTFASLSIISLTKGNISLSDHLLVTGVTRMENTGQIYNAAKTKLISAGKAPILVEPLSAKFVLYRPKADPKLRVRALDANGQPLKSRVSAKWVKNNFVFSWVPSAFYLEILK